MAFDKLLRKDWMPKFGFSRRNDEAYVKFATFDGTTSIRKKFGLAGKFFSFGLATVKSAVVTLVSASNAVAVNAASGNIWYHLLTESTTVAAPSNLTAGTIYTLMIVQDASSAKTIAFNAVFKLKGNWVKNAALNSVDTLKFYSDGTSLFQISASSPAYAPLQRAKVVLTSSGSAVAIDAALGDYWYHIFTEDTTLGAPTNLKAGAKYTLHLVQHGSSVKTLGFNGVFKIAGGSFTVTATNSAIDILEFISDGTNLYEVSRSQVLA